MRRFLNPSAQFLFVPGADVLAVAEHFNATPFDVPGARLGHHGQMCSFDTFLHAFDSQTEPLMRMAKVIRAADLGNLNDACQAAGLLAISVGLSRLKKNDDTQLEAGLLIYDALYRWARDGFEETHTS